ncbi:hypothetical protein [Chelativorans alearense]|uniref:hypothetical protein n=1 Tax=Chelativorans alearense TaxID=2681495 RepID=UPI0013D321F8|nr:hypothetical protein [Chelativorans alearense]
MYAPAAHEPGIEFMRNQLSFAYGAVGLAAVVSGAFPALADSRMWVAVEDLRRFTCPSTQCGIVGRFFFRETLPVLETSNGWSRVSRQKAAGCFDGKSLYVESGPSDCTAENGIKQGKFSEWVRSKFLVEDRPSEPMEGPKKDHLGES